MSPLCKRYTGKVSLDGNVSRGLCDILYDVALTWDRCEARGVRSILPQHLSEKSTANRLNFKSLVSGRLVLCLGIGLSRIEKANSIVMRDARVGWTRVKYLTREMRMHIVSVLSYLIFGEKKRLPSQIPFLKKIPIENQCAFRKCKHCRNRIRYRRYVPCEFFPFSKLEWERTTMAQVNIFILYDINNSIK